MSGQIHILCHPKRKTGNIPQVGIEVIRKIIRHLLVQEVMFSENSFDGSSCALIGTETLGLAKVRALLEVFSYLSLGIDLSCANEE